MNQRTQNPNNMNSNMEMKMKMEEKHTDNLVFTRYLYPENDVTCSLVTSILKKDNDAAFFWSCELLYSGLAEKLTHTLWTAYLQYFFASNFEFYNYMEKQTEQIKCDYLKTTSDNKTLDEKSVMRDAEKAIHAILRNLAIRPRCNSVANLWTHVSDDEDNSETVIKAWDFWVSTGLESDLDHPAIAETNRKKVKTTAKKLAKNHNIPCQALKNIAIHKLIENLKNKNKMGKKLFLAEPSDNDHDSIFQPLRTKGRIDTPCTSQGTPFQRHQPHKILPTFATRGILDGIDTSKINPSTCKPATSFINAYFYHWLYYASSTPIWKHRIDKYKTSTNHQTKEIDFDSDEDLEQFHEEYGLEPDEQSADMHKKNLALLQWEGQESKKLTWSLKLHPGIPVA